MNIKWRIFVLLLQLSILIAVTTIVTSKPVVNEIWFFSGLLAIIINPTLLEPWYAKPQDVLANTIIGLFLTFVANKASTQYGWIIVQIFLLFFFFITLILILSSFVKDEATKVKPLNFAKSLSRIANSSTIYSTIFWLSILESYPIYDKNFWLLGGSWALMIIISKINWQGFFYVISNKPSPASPITMIGPSYILVSSQSLPNAGSRLLIKYKNETTNGILINTITRPDDEWGQILVDGKETCNKIMHCSEIELTLSEESIEDNFIGSIDEGSNNYHIKFTATKFFEIGKIVIVKYKSDDILFQVNYAEIDKVNIKEGAHLITKITARQLGVFDKKTCKIENLRWIPSACMPVNIPSEDYGSKLELRSAQELIKIGTLIGTSLPVFLDPRILTETHMAILGMTRMGKTSIAMHIINALQTTTRITVLDQSGEFVSRRHLPKYEKGDDNKANGVSVYEPPKGSVYPDIALKYLNSLVDIARVEYESDTTRSRILLIDEAHQFIPEPAGLGFNSPGRDSSFQFGLLMMQVRKYGISIIFISQRTAVVAKSALSQCENIIAFKSVDQTGLDYLESFLGSEFKTLLPALNHGEAVVFGPAISSNTGVAINTFNKK
jgi:hypothetical protein